MLRITKQSENENTTRLRLDGKLDLESYVELDALCSRPDSPQHSMVVLDMSGVVYMSEEAARKLNERRGDSLHIVNCSPFIEMLLGNTGNQ